MDNFTTIDKTTSWGHENTPCQQLWGAFQRLDEQSKERKIPYSLERIDYTDFSKRNIKDETEYTNLISQRANFYSLRCNPERTKCNIYFGNQKLYRTEMHSCINQYADRYDKRNF